MKTYGLIGYRLGHSFSKKFFTDKFAVENLSDHRYLNFELDYIQEFPGIFERDETICGLNCTIPYKQQIIEYMDEIDPVAAKIGAVNTVKISFKHGKRILKGYNTDLYGFENSLKPMLKPIHKKALILGTGGASKAIKYLFDKMGIKYLSATTQKEPGKDEISYQVIDEATMSKFLIIINATPLGTYPKVNECPDIPYEFLTSDHILYDLVYNPEETLFLKKGKERGAQIKNGLEMLHLQALKSWEIWNS